SNSRRRRFGLSPRFDGTNSRRSEPSQPEFRMMLQVPRRIEMFCHHCGNPVRAEVRFCPSCGRPLPETAIWPVAAMPSRVCAHATGCKVQTGRWLGEVWALVQADLGNYLLISLLFLLLNGVPFIQGALI